MSAAPSSGWHAVRSAQHRRPASFRRDCQQGTCVWTCVIYSATAFETVASDAHSKPNALTLGNQNHQPAFGSRRSFAPPTHPQRRQPESISCSPLPGWCHNRPWMPQGSIFSICQGFSVLMFAVSKKRETLSLTTDDSYIFEMLLACQNKTITFVLTF